MNSKPTVLTAFAAYCLLVFVVVGEEMVRVSGRESRHFYDAVYQPFDDDIPFVHKPNLRGVRGWGNTIFNTDALGLRSVAGGERLEPKALGEYRVALVGDSVTFGQGVGSAEVFSRLVEERSSQAGTESAVRAFNFGVCSYSVRQMAATVERRVAVVDPDLVLTVLIPADFDLGRTGTLDAWGRVQPSGRTQGLEWVKRPLRRMHLAYFLRDLYWGEQPSWTSTPLDGVPPSYAYIVRLRLACEAQRLRCGFVTLSTKIDDGFGPVIERLRREGLPILDLTALKDEFTVEQFNAGPHDPHPSAAVHRRIAEELVPWILARRTTSALEFQRAGR